mgnify:CR=1 FL=1
MELHDAESYVRARLFALQDPDYRVFHSRLIPNVPPENIIGVRIPLVRRLAAEISADPGIAEPFMSILPHKYYDEYNLHALLIERIGDYDRTTAELDRFLPFVDNWATCDLLRPRCFCRHLPELRGKIAEWMASDTPYAIRFGIEMLMCFYLDDAFTPDVLECVAAVRSEEYYVRMMEAWFFATALAKRYDDTVPYIEQRRLDCWTHNRAIRKAVESFRVADAHKAYLRTLRIR